jgi:SET domain-containing protein
MTDKITGYLPLPDYLTIKKSKLHGLGLFALEDIMPRQDLGITHVEDKRFTSGYIRTPLGGFINYASTPNCEFIYDKDMLRLKTLRSIRAGEELTVDYRPWYDEAVLATFN